MAGSHDTEVAVVERGHVGGIEAFGDGHDRGVCGAEGQVVVGADQLRHAGHVGALERDELEDARGEIVEERCLEQGGPAGFMQVADFGEHRRGNQQWPREAGQQGPARGMILVAVVGQGN